MYNVHLPVYRPYGETLRADPRLGHSCSHKSAPCSLVVHLMPDRVKANVPWFQVSLNSSGLAGHPLCLFQFRGVLKST